MSKNVGELEVGKGQNEVKVLKDKQLQVNKTDKKDLIPKKSKINLRKMSLNECPKDNQTPQDLSVVTGPANSTKASSTYGKEKAQSDLNDDTSSRNQLRKRRQITDCPHKDREHYAKNMCHNCYHRRGKSKMAHGCGHPHKQHYSQGMCQNCYLAKYYIKRKLKQTKKQLSLKNK